MIGAWLVLAVAPGLVPRLARAEPVRFAVLAGHKLRLLGDTYHLVREVDSDASELSWSRDGQWLALLSPAGKLSVLDVKASASTPKELADKAVNLDWARDGHLNFGIPGAGISSVLPDGKTVSLTISGDHPSSSPDGANLAFTISGPAGGLWLGLPDGSGARRLLKSATAAGCSWSYDSRWLAVIADGHLRTIRRNGLEAKDLGEVGGTTVAWSAGSPYLVCKREDKWQVWSAIDNAWTSLHLDAERQPRWIGARRLLGTLHGVPAIEDLEREPYTITSDEDVSDVVRIPGIYMGQAFPDPFANAPRPERGDHALRGKVLYCDPIDGVLNLSVETSTDSRGTETNYGKLEVRKLKVASSVRMRLTILPETDVWVAEKRGVATDIRTADAPVVEPKRVKERFHRDRRNLEYDGVSLDHVVVPMIYPIPGKHKFVDTFLAPRDGGNRRHHGNDLMSRKMTPLLAVFDGVVSFYRTKTAGAHNILTLDGDDGYSATYMHINNDTPGTDDGEGSWRYAFPADLQPGDRVKAGEVVAYCGDSGNAENTAPHLHFELYDEDGRAVLDPAFSLKAAQRLAAPRYVDPDPGLKPQAGELRYDAVITQIDLNKRVIAAELTGGSSSRTPIHRVTMPRMVYFRVPLSALFHYRGTADLEYPLEALQPGLRLSAVGTMSGESMVIRKASTALAYRD